MRINTTADIVQFEQLCQQQTHAQTYPLAQSIDKNIPIYFGDTIRQNLEKALVLQAEWVQVLAQGPGVFVIKNFFEDLKPVATMSEVFQQLLAQHAHQPAGDHFAEPGANQRIWNVLQKSALFNPQAFIDYYQNPLWPLVAEAWLGPAYQLTAQVNIVRPGGKAQAPHRDYHLGFQSLKTIADYPLHVHQFSAMLTLQGAIAHTDMPIASGPTQLLPYSQQYELGYLAWHLPEFQDYFAAHAVQLPLNCGDAVFFNPALFHAAGHNHTADIERCANLVQISSALGRSMEQLDRYAMAMHLYPSLIECYAQLNSAQRHAVLANCCEGYAFPTNLDRDPPIEGIAPINLYQLTGKALEDRWPVDKFTHECQQHAQRRCA